MFYAKSMADWCYNRTERYRIFILSGNKLKQSFGAEIIKNFTRH